MASIKFITADQDEIIVTAESGSVMEAAVAHNIKGIDGDCGGVCSCATCHVHVAPEDFDRLQPRSELEDDMLEFDDNATDYSRLSCQIPVTEAIDGITLTVAQG